MIQELKYQINTPKYAQYLKLEHESIIDPNTQDCIIYSMLEDNLHPTSYPPFADNEIGA